VGHYFGSPDQDVFAAVQESANGRFCCKSLFALAIKNSFGRRRDFRVKMWGTSSPEDKLTGDLGNVIEATSIGGRRSDFFTSGKLAPGNLGLLQHYRHEAGQSLCDGCPQLVEADIRAFGRHSGFDPELT
jgi:hypothetical protein